MHNQEGFQSCRTNSPIVNILPILLLCLFSFLGGLHPAFHDSLSPYGRKWWSGRWAVGWGDDVHQEASLVLGPAFGHPLLCRQCGLASLATPLGSYNAVTSYWHPVTSCLHPVTSCWRPITACLPAQVSRVPGSSTALSLCKKQGPPKGIVAAFVIPATATLGL